MIRTVRTTARAEKRDIGRDVRIRGGWHRAPARYGASRRAISGTASGETTKQGEAFMAVSEKAGDVLMRAKRRIGIENPSAADDDGNVGIVRGALRAFGEGDTDR